MIHSADSLHAGAAAAQERNGEQSGHSFKKEHRALGEPGGGARTMMAAKMRRPATSVQHC